MRRGLNKLEESFQMFGFKLSFKVTVKDTPGKGHPSRQHLGAKRLGTGNR